MEIQFNVDDLLKWARAFDEAPKRSKAAIARALNTVGTQIERSAASAVAEQSDLDPNDVMGMINITEATPEDLAWEMDASAVALQQLEWSKPWEKSTDHSFDQETLLNIITCDDETVCEICSEAAANGPYSAEEIQNLTIKWKDYVPPNSVTGTRTNLLHPNCRCSTQPWKSYRRIPVALGSSGAATAPMTAEQIGKAIGEELVVEMKNVLKESELAMDVAAASGV